jgi:hypothetical protein
MLFPLFLPSYFDFFLFPFLRFQVFSFLYFNNCFYSYVLSVKSWAIRQLGVGGDGARARGLQCGGRRRVGGGSSPGRSEVGWPDGVALRRLVCGW